MNLSSRTPPAFVYIPAVVNYKRSLTPSLYPPIRHSLISLSYPIRRGILFLRPIPSSKPRFIHTKTVRIRIHTSKWQTVRRWSPSTPSFLANCYCQHKMKISLLYCEYSLLTTASLLVKNLIFTVTHSSHTKNHVIFTRAVNPASNILSHYPGCLSSTCRLSASQHCPAIKIPLLTPRTKTDASKAPLCSKQSLLYNKLQRTTLT